MSKDSKTYRAKAANQLKLSRNGGSTEEKSDNLKRAAAYKSLADNETWLDGEPKHGRPPKKRT